MCTNTTKQQVGLIQHAKLKKMPPIFYQNLLRLLSFSSSYMRTKHRFFVFVLYFTLQMYVLSVRMMCARVCVLNDRFCCNCVIYIIDHMLLYSLSVTRLLIEVTVSSPISQLSVCLKNTPVLESDESFTRPGVLLYIITEIPCFSARSLGNSIMYRKKTHSYFQAWG